jgi:hypothetical protein
VSLEHNLHYRLAPSRSWGVTSGRDGDSSGAGAGRH